VSSTCEYWLRPDEQCRRPAVADYFEVDPLKGERHVSSNCAAHDGPATRRFAMAKGYERRDRRSLSVVADEFWQGDSA
jgi:hypothetical protein